MERGFGIRSDITGGGGHSHFTGVETPAATTMGVDDAFLNGCFSELSFQSILQPTSASPTSLNYCSVYDVGVSAASHAHFQYPASSRGYFEQTLTFPASETTPPKKCPLTHQNLKMPKDERFDSQEFAFQLLKLNNPAGVPQEPLINFFSNADDAAIVGVGNAFTGSLGSPEPRQDALEVACHTPSYQAGSLNEIFTVNHHQLIPESSSSSSFNRVNSIKNSYMPYFKSSDTARQRRQRIGEKTRRLQRLLPWDKKMDTGTMLEEAYKYVKFLQAQVSILQAMSLQSSTPPPPPSNPSSDVAGRFYHENNNPLDNVVWGELGKLNRQQLLQVMVNSPAAQTLLYSRGCCVYSREQLALLQKLAEKKAFWEQMMFASPFHFHY